MIIANTLSEGLPERKNKTLVIIVTSSTLEYWIGFVFQGRLILEGFHAISTILVTQ